MAFKKNLIFSGIVFVFLISNVSAIVLNSSNYSVGMFGTGMATATSTSTNYNMTFLSEVAGTTDGANSITYTANIGFFDSPYSRTVSISSYSISPASAVVGSTISLSISALNSESVWAVVTAPNTQQQTITLVNDNTVTFLPNPSVVGTYTVTFYANSSTGAIASAIDTFVLTEATPVIPSSGGSTSTCTYIWECSSWSVCYEGNQTRICENTGTCRGEEGKPIEERACEDSLFDVLLSFDDLIITENKTLKFDVALIEQKGIEKIDVQIMYSIINDYGEEIFNQIETRAVQGELKFEKELKEAILGSGEYILRVDILYGNQQKAYAEQRFEVKKGEIGLLPPKKPFDMKIIYIGIIILLLLIICFLIRRRRKKKYGRKSHKKYQSKIRSNLNKIRSKNFAIIAFGGTIVGFLFVGNKVFTGFAIGESYSGISIGFVGFILLFALVGLIFVSKKKIKVGVAKIKEKKERKNLPKESVKGLIGRKVYTEEGDLVGKVKEIMVGENRIIELLIKFDKKVTKKNKIKLKGLTMKYREVESVGHVVIIKDKIWDHINKSKNIKEEKHSKK